MLTPSCSGTAMPKQSFASCGSPSPALSPHCPFLSGGCLSHFYCPRVAWHLVLGTAERDQKSFSEKCPSQLSWELLPPSFTLEMHQMSYVWGLVCFGLVLWWDRVSLNSLGCSRTPSVYQAGLELTDLPASVSWALELEPCAATIQWQMCPETSIHQGKIARPAGKLPLFRALGSACGRLCPFRPRNSSVIITVR